MNILYYYSFLHFYINHIGTIRDNQPLLLSVDDALFPNDIALTNHISLYRANSVQNVADIVNVFSSKGINISGLNANGNWIVIQTDREVSIPVDGIESY